jgi:hypothetical protein
MWAPSDDIYLAKQDAPHVRPNRPLHQGDVFVNVPLSIARRQRNEEGSYFNESDEATVMLIGAPCSIRAGNRTLPVQSVVEVVRMDEVVNPGHGFAFPYQGSYWHLFPLPQLMPGVDYVANFRKIGTSPTVELQDARTVCLNRPGWTALQSRYIYHSIRYEVTYQQMYEASVSAWNEVELWEKWNEAGLPELDFEAWMLEPVREGRYAGTIRRAAVGFAPDELEAEFPDP